VWFFKTNSTKFWVKFLERFGSPLLVGKVGGDRRVQADIDAMTSALLNAHSQSVISIGSEDDINTVGTNFSGAGSSAFEAFDTVMTKRVQKVVLGQTLTSGNDGGGSRALGEVHENVRMDKRNSDLRMITPVVQDIINALCLLNGFEKHTIILGGEQDLNIKVVERDLKLKTLGVEFNDQYIKETYGLKPEHFKVRTESIPANTQFTALPRQAFNFKADMQGLDANQREVDDKIDVIDKRLFSESELLKVVESSADVNDLQAKLYESMSSESVEKFNTTMARALYLFDVVGYVQRSK
jgi:phage gp29-like protein